ncbi:MAG: ATP-dependent RNA helicase HrpA [Burkholderiales bacterium]|nr:ATP-dependent RNA helicase HrpA [Burkholderiales bacterium]
MSDTPPLSEPRIEFPPELPISAEREAIAAALRAHPVVIVCAETGSGKTTQLPKIAWAAGRGRTGLIGLTQPRRIAARSVAARLAQETGTELGGFIGWQVRFTDHVGPATRIKVMTDGILLAEIQGDPHLAGYDTLILDEVHERSLNIDFLLGYLKLLLKQRQDLKLILSSATLEAERFAAWFEGAPVLEVAGRTYPVEIRYRPPLPAAAPAQDDDKTGAGAETDVNAALLAAVDELAAEGPGDILVFLPGEREIREAQEALRKHHPPDTEILPLYARLSLAEQQRVFQPHTGRRIVLATNVAETSITVPGIRYVVDTGLARVKRYSLRLKIEQLKIEPIAQSAARQRAGRCGRLGPGIAIRLYDEQDYLARPAHTTPELLRSSLAGVILRMKALGLPPIETFPFPDPPEPKRVRDGLALLAELNALDDQAELTVIGRELARLPVDPRIGRMLIAARGLGCLAEVLVIAAFLSVQDPRERPLDAQAAADERHRRHADAHSDFLAILRLWRHINELNAHRKSQRKFRAALQAEFLSPLRVREWRDVHGQLANLVKEQGWPVGELHAPPEPDQPAASWPLYAPLHQALLAGLLGNVGMLTDEGDYLGARGLRFVPHPASGVRGKPKWIVAAEIVHTRRVYARTVARVEPQWIEQAGRHLLKLSYSDPHWEKRSAQVAASLRATLYGLPVVSGRRVHYGPIDPVLSRELFIRHALVRGEWDCRAPFFQHNRRLLAELEELAERSRNPRLAPDEDALYAFFDALIPAGIHNGRDFEAWRREAEQSQPRLLFLEREHLLPAQGPSEAEFPHTLTLGGAAYTLAYRFEPGADDDGVTLCLPLAALNQLPATAGDWLVPGLLAERIEALIRTLPQALRRHCTPVAEFARAAAQALAPLAAEDPPADLVASLTAFIRRATGADIPRPAWRPEALPAHLVMNYRILDADGRVLVEGRDLAALRRRLAPAAGEALQASAADWRRDGITAWDFDTLPEEAVVQSGRTRLTVYPALALQDDGSVALRPFDTRAAARTAHRQGVCRLLWLAHADHARQTERMLTTRLKNACLQWALFHPGLGCAGLVREIMQTACAEALQPLDAADVRSGDAFTAAWQSARPRLSERIEALATLAQGLIDTASRLNGQFERAPAAWRGAVEDMRQQLAALLPPDFLSATAPAWRRRLPAYLQALELRLQKLARDPRRDAAAARELAPLLDAWREAARQRPDDPALTEFRWLLEELRIALFAQEVRTAQPVSVKRLQQRWQALQSASRP